MDKVYVETAERHFHIVKAYWERTTPTFIVETRGGGFRHRLLKPAFKALAAELKNTGYLPRVRWIVDSYHISILKSNPPVKEKPYRNIILLGATILTMTLDGYIRSNNPIFRKELMPGTPVIVNTGIFVLSILLIFAVHEYSHRYAAKKHRARVSHPYFIPAPPGMGGTAGAIIRQEEPPINRDALFDIGLSGPVGGFIATVLVALVGLRMSYVVSVEQVNRWMFEYPAVRFRIMPMPLLLEVIANLVKPIADNEVLIMHPVAFATWVGCVVTSINLMPSWQLDGGHIIRSLLGRESHKIVSVAGVILLLFSGYILMGVIVAFMMMRPGLESVEPLDDLSSLSISRKLCMILYIGVLLFSLVVLHPV